MPRPRPPGQIDRLLDAAERVFAARGPERAQVTMIAREACVAPGTLYHYFESKEALLGWVALRARDPAVVLPCDVPLPAPPGSLRELLVPNQDLSVSLPMLSEAAGRPASGPIRDELTAVVLEFYRRVEAGRRLSSLVQAAASDVPEVGEAWTERVVRLVELWARYLARRVDERLLRPLAEPVVAARFVIETCTYFGRTRVEGTPAEAALDDDVVRDMTVSILVRGLLNS